MLQSTNVYWFCFQANRDHLGLALRGRREREGATWSKWPTWSHCWWCGVHLVAVVGGGGGTTCPSTAAEHSYCMLGELQEAISMKEEEGQTVSAYQNSHNTLPTLLEHKLDMHSCMVWSI